MGQTGSLTQNVYDKIVQVHNDYTTVYNSNGLTNIASDSQFAVDAIQKKNFALLWTFLKNSMGLNTHQIAGVMGNIHAESAFSADNARDAIYPGKHNPEYVYACNDEVAYGLLQWCDSTRKTGLLNMSNSMRIDASDINAQLAYFRKEMTETIAGLANYPSAWNEIKAATSYSSACDIFLEKIESPRNPNYSQRRAYSAIIYNAMISEMGG